MTIVTVSTLSDRELESELARLAQGERAATVALLVHLAEFDARRLFEPAGFPSLFRYCLEVLRLSEDATYSRIESARAARRFPGILDLLASGSLSLTTARILARKLTVENHRELLAAASGLTREKVEELLSRRFPLPDVADSVRKCPVPKSSVPSAVAAVPVTVAVPPAMTAAAVVAPVAAAPSVPLTSVPSPPPTSRRTVSPLSPERYEIRFTARAETRELLRTAQDLIADSVPDSDLDGVFHRALELLVADLERRKCAATESPRPSRGQAEGSRSIPAHVKRIVWSRDGGRCAFGSGSGHRCEARRHLHFHHVIPYAAGGKPTADNIQLRCRAHNNHEARVFYGPVREYVDLAPPATRSGTGAPAHNGRSGRAGVSPSG